MAAALTERPETAQDGGRALLSNLSELTRSRIETDGVPGAVVALIVGGAPVRTAAFGLADPGTGRAMTADALFRVESISKPVTAWGAMRLARTGRLDLDAPITHCLEDWHPPGGLQPITPRQLLSHTVGIGLGDFADRYAPGEARPGLAAHLSDDFATIGAPGARFAYSDTGFNLLELVIEACMGADFAALMDREILTPLGMTRASFDWTGAEMPIGHDLRSRPVPPRGLAGTNNTLMLSFRCPHAGGGKPNFAAAANAPWPQPGS